MSGRPAVSLFPVTYSGAGLSDSLFRLTFPAIVLYLFRSRLPAIWVRDRGCDLTLSITIIAPARTAAVSLAGRVRLWPARRRIMLDDVSITVT